MSSDIQHIRIGLTDNHPCSYLPGRQERVAVALDPSLHCSSNYEVLLANGFRRSGDTIYRPLCQQCNACEPIRVSAHKFKMTRSQKRLRNKAGAITWQFKEQLDADWYELYARYIEARHSAGSMYPPNRQSFEQFTHCNWLNTQYLHLYEDDTLIGVAVTDILSNSASAFYTFYEPSHPLSLGTLGVLLQLEHCQEQGKQWLYLGYQIDECPAMNYKVRFHPHQRLVNQSWQG